MPRSAHVLRIAAALCALVCSLTVPARAQTTIDWANLQWPSSITVDQNTSTPTIYGRVYVAGLTEATGPQASLAAQVGFGPDGSDPATAAGWQWTAATFNLDVGNDDEYMAFFTPGSAGTYDYAFRFSRNSGAWVYADLDGTTNGYSAASAGALTVTGPPTTIDWANLQFPSSITVSQNTATPTIYGRVYVAGLTEATGPQASLEAQVGFGPDGSDPATAVGWQWTAAGFNFDIGNDDEYMAALTPATAGTFDFAFRCRRNSGPWTYADLDGTSNGYSPANAGSLTVEGTASVLPAAPALRLAVSGNPFRDAARFTVSTAVEGEVELAVFDVRGARVRTLLAGRIPAGTRPVTWDGRDAHGATAASGVFSVRLVSAGEQRSVRVVRMR